MNRLADPIGAHTRGPFIGTRGDRRQGREREQKENELGLQWNANKPETRREPRTIGGGLFARV